MMTGTNMGTDMATDTGTASGSAFSAMRHAMVASQLRPNAVSDARVVEAMATVAREDFLPAGARALAYRDTAIALGGARFANLPMVTGRLLTEAYLTHADRVLLIGAAGGYTAAVLSHLVAQVVAVESDSALAALARSTLADARGVTVIEGPLDAGYAEAAPYDVLIVDGAIETVPDALVTQVRSGGRVVAGIVDRGVTRLTSGRRTGGGFALVPFADLDCVVLPGFTIPKSFTF